MQFLKIQKSRVVFLKFHYSQFFFCLLGGGTKEEQQFRSLILTETTKCFLDNKAAAASCDSDFAGRGERGGDPS